MKTFFIWLSWSLEGVLNVSNISFSDSEDNSYFQLQPEPTPQLKPRPLGMESCKAYNTYISLDV